MDRHNLRSQYDLEKDRDLIITHLATTGPPATNPNAVGYETSGLQCLIIVLRRILVNYAYLGLDGLDQIRDESGAVHPLLELVWRNFLVDEKPSVNCSPPTSIEVLMKRTMDLSGKNGSSFLDLVECQAMNEQVWSKPDFVLYRPVLQEARGWVEETTERYNRHCTFPIAYTAKGSSLQEAIDGKFGIRLKKNGTREIWNSNEPSFVRILCTVVLPISISDVQSFTMPVGRIEQHPEGHSTYNKDSFRLRYNLIAVVRLRLEQNEPDLVHTYLTNGKFLQLHTHAPERFNTKWLMEEQGYHDFYLVYARSDAPPI